MSPKLAEACAKETGSRREVPRSEEMVRGRFMLFDSDMDEQ
jgi:hypothetical protein